MDTLFLALALIILFYVLFFYLYNKWKRDRISVNDRKFFNRHWEDLLDENDGSHQIIKADKLLDQMLVRRGMGGSLGDKLKLSGNKLFSKLNDLWSAHKLRNKIAHELGFTLSENEKKVALKAYESAFKDLGLL